MMKNIPKHVTYAFEKLKAHGYSCFIVGGAVRDFIMNRAVNDYDLCTSATPYQMQSIFKDDKIIDTGIKHGTITVVIDKKYVEITTFRTENEYINFRKPQKVSFVKQIEKDLARRDFTINAIACTLDGKFIDLFDGQNDIKNKIIRAVGNADERFKQDALRILRALRFCSEFGFDIEQKTKEAIYKNKELLLYISGERILNELKKILCARYAGRVLREYIEIFVVILNDLKDILGLEQRNKYHIYDVFEHTIRAVEELEPDFVLRFSALYHDTGKADCMTVDENGIGHFYAHSKFSKMRAQNVCKKFNISNDIKKQIFFLIENHDIFIKDDINYIKNLLAEHGERKFRQLLKLQRADSIARGTHREYLMNFISIEDKLKSILDKNDCISLKALTVNGDDIKNMGFHGEEIGKILKKTFNYVIENPEKNTKQQLLNFIRENIK